MEVKQELPKKLQKGFGGKPSGELHLCGKISLHYEGFLLA
jgi:hypothetical protein